MALRRKSTLRRELSHANNVCWPDRVQCPPKTCHCHLGGKLRVNTSKLQQTPITIGALEQLLSTAPVRNEHLMVWMIEMPSHPVPLPVRMWRSSPAVHGGGPLIVLFGGAVDQKKRTPPVFQWLKLSHIVESGGTVISIADPSLRRDEEVIASFYQGDDACDTPRMIDYFLETVLEAVRPTRLVVTGNSVGAHAALCHAARRPEAVAIAVSMIGDIAAHWSRTIGVYRSKCWPNLSAPGMAQQICMQAGSKYKSPDHATVICLQNATDQHIARQTAPFLSMVSDRTKVLLVSEFLPRLQGHRGHQYCQQRWADWITAAVNSETNDPPIHRFNPLRTVASIATRYACPTRPIRQGSSQSSGRVQYCGS